MGIPAAFRWLSQKYPKIISPVAEDQPVVLEDGSVVPVDTTRPNPNGEEFDNLYLDMNGIVHPCSHPEDKPAPKNEEEMMVEIFKYTDRVVNMVRPRKLLMIAVDGVAPRAKMNQQRSRRFRAAQEAQEKEEDKKKFLELLRKEGQTVEEESVETTVQKAFDSNSITPGTPFMEILAASLRYWCAYKLNTDPAWARMKVIISDATVPGEGEHKIMDFIRSQRASPDHDPNTRHVIYGLDADLIMLGLATHEPHFRVLREDVFFQDSKAKMCKLCGQKGHDERVCKGEVKRKDGEFDEKDNAQSLKPFIWLHVSILREYLAAELDVPGMPFRFDLERAIDDWVFLCFFVGNDFLPHLPALEIRENGIDTLTAIWKDNLPHMGGYLTKDGHVNLERAQYIMDGLAKQEDAIFRRRKETEDRREAGAKRRRLQTGKPPGHQDAPISSAKSRNRVPEIYGPPPGIELHPISSFPSKAAPAITHDMVVNRRAIDQANVANKSAAGMLKSQLQGLTSRTSNTSKDGEGHGRDDVQAAASALGKRKASLMGQDSIGTTEHNNASEAQAGSYAENEAPSDSVRLWEEGYADRYYQEKFHVDPKDTAFRHKVARAYVEGLAWVLMYYFQGCPSWEWFYPYHYAPFAADFVGLAEVQLNFDKGRISRPFEQLMSVLPAASRHAIPEAFHDLMMREDSDIIDFYPTEFEVDLNGKKMAWQGVALLPFIDMPRLLAAMETRYHLLSPEDQARNSVGKDILLISDSLRELYDEITANFYSKKQGLVNFKLDPRTSGGLAGKVQRIEGYYPHGLLVYPLDKNAVPDVEYDRSLSVNYEMPSGAGTHKSMLLRGVKLPMATLNRSDIETLKGKALRSGRSYGGAVLSSNNSYLNGGRQETINYGPGMSRPRSYHSDRSQVGYGKNGYHNPREAYRSSPGWQLPPPPGSAQFGVGMPPPLLSHPPPSASYVHGSGGSGGSGAYSYNTGSNTAHGTFPPSARGYQGQYPNAHLSQNYYYPPPPGDNRRYRFESGSRDRDFKEYK